MRWPCEKHVYERPAYEKHAYERKMHAYGRHAYGIIYWRCTSIKYPSTGDIFKPASPTIFLPVVASDKEDL
jgi:hypothetical protein